MNKIAFAALFAFTVLVYSCEQTYAQKAVSVASDSLMSRSNIKGPLQFKGFVKELSKQLKGAVVTLYESPDGSKDNLTEILKTVTGGNGQFEFKLEVNKFYVLSVEKGGYTTKKVDFDTDVTMAREQYTSVPTFSFVVDMVQDLDGLAYAGSVASVFYQIKRNEFDYQLDYSKEEMEEEERLLREQEEKRRLAELAAQKKFEMEEAARVLRENENASAQELIKAAVTVGNGDKEKTIAGFLKVFSEVDSLRDKKAAAMYDQLLEERKTSTATGAKIDFQNIFKVAQKVEEEVVKKAEEERNKSVEALRKEKEEAARKMNEAMAIQQQSLELIAKEKLAAAVKEEELRQAAKEKEERDKVYYAIFESNGDGAAAIQNLIKTYPKNDPYKEQKAKAIYEEYERLRMTGSTLSQMNFGQLFAAASTAEQQAIQKDIENDNNKQQSKLNAFMERVEEKKREEQNEIVKKIETGLSTASADKASQIAVFKEALPKNDPYKDQKAAVMYEEYVRQKKSASTLQTQLNSAPDNKEAQLAIIRKSISPDTPNKEAVAQKMYDDFVSSKQKLGGTGVVNIDFSSLFQVADTEEAKIKQEAKEQLVKEKQQAQDQLEAQREAIRKEKTALAEKTALIVEESHKAKMADAKNKKEKALAEALESGGGDRDASVNAIMKILDSTGDKELDQERASAVYDTYLLESKNIKESGKLGTKVDFSALFQAADKAELARLEKRYEAKQAQEQERLAEYSERRIQQATEIAKAQQQSAEKQVEQAEVAYEETLLKVEAERQERLAEQKRKEEQLAKAKEMEQMRRVALENEKKDAELARIEAERQQRLDAERKAQEALLNEELAARRKQEEEAQRLADLKLAEMEKARLAAEEEARLAEATRLKEEEKRKAAEEKAKRDAELALAKEAEESRRLEAQRLKEEEKRKAEELKAQQAAELAAQKEAERKLQEEKDRLAAEEKARKDAELAAAKAAEDERKAEERKAQAERDRLAAEEKARQEAELAAAKAAEEARKAEEQRQAELAKQKAEEAEKQRLANYESLVIKGDGAFQNKNYQLALSNYQEAKQLYPENKDLLKKLGDTESQLDRLAKEEADRLALDQQYNGLMKDGQSAFDKADYNGAIAKFEQALALKPSEQAPKQKIQAANSELEQLALAEKEKQAKERQFVLLMQEGNSALGSNDLAAAKSKFEDAQALKPQDPEPKSKLKEIAQKEQELAAAELEKKRKEEEAKKKFEEQQRLEEEAKAKELAARIAAIEQTQAAAAPSNAEEARIQKYEKLKETIEQLDLAAEEQRKAFLSELAKIYPEGMTKEQVNGKNFVLLRHVINKDNVVTIYEKKTWDWGGVFYFKDSDIAITEAIYKLEIGKYQ